MNTFSEMIFKEYEKCLYKKSSDFMSDDYPFQLKIYDFHISGVYIHLGNGNTLQFDVEVNFKWYRDKEYREDLVIPCSCELGKAISNFAAGQPMFKGNYVPPKILLSDYLIPDIRRRQYDELGHEFLEKYNVDSLHNKTPIFIEDVVKSEGLTIVKNRRLTKDGSVMGMVVFEDGDIVDSRLGVFIKGAKAGTIYIDKRVCESPERERYTLMHELVHWFYHRQYFLFSKIAHAIDSKAIICMDEENQKIDECDEIYKLIESQANGIAARILMEKEAFISKYKELKPEAEVYYREDTGDIELKKLYYILRSIAKFFEVSVQSAKIRFMELGYMEFDGISNYLGSGEGRSIKIPDYTFSSGALKRGETFFVDWDDYVKAAYENKGLFELAIHKKIIYVDGHLVLNTPQYVEHSGNGNRLTEYANTHLDECGFIFSSYEEREPFAYSGVQVAIYRKTLIGITFTGKDYLSSKSGNKHMEQLAQEYEIEEDRSLYDYKILGEALEAMQNASFPKAFLIVLRWRDCYVTDEKDYILEIKDGQVYVNLYLLQRITGINDHRLKDYLCGRKRPDFLELVNICHAIGVDDVRLVIGLIARRFRDITKSGDEDSAKATMCLYNYYENDFDTCIQKLKNINII